MNEILKKVVVVLSLLIAVLPLMAQTTLDFIGKDANGQTIPLDSVQVNNLTHGWMEVLDASDLSLTMNNMGINQHDLQPLLSQNVPNPFDGITDFSLQLKKSDKVDIGIFTMEGKKVVAFSKILDAGCHTFRVYLSKPQTYLLNLKTGTENGSIKIVNTGTAGMDRIHYSGYGGTKTVSIKSEKGNTNNLFEVGDTLSFVGYSTIGGEFCASLVVTQPILSSQTVELQFTRSEDSFVCGTSLVFDYDNNPYNTVQIGFQCWLKENVRTTHFADGEPIPVGTTSSYTNAYCCYPDNNIAMVPYYGMLYNWPAVMQMDFDSGETGVQSVCPDGWHVPCEQEWYTLIYFMEAHSAFQCDSQPDNIAKALASTTGWQNCGSSCTVGYMPSTNNASGFKAMPSGTYCDYYDDESFGYETWFWSSTESWYNSAAPAFYLTYDRRAMSRWEYSQKYFLSVRCLLDEEDSVHTSSGQPCPQTPTVIDYDGNVYNTVQIGTQCWMRENLKTAHYANGSLIPLGNEYSSTVGYRYFPEGDSGYVNTYGCLYNWAAVMNGASSSTSVPSNVQGICPNGWHVPSASEWLILSDYVSALNECQCGHRSEFIAKALSSATGWYGNTQYCSPGYSPMYNNASGFSALPASYYYGGGYGAVGTEAWFWSSTGYENNVAYYRNIFADEAFFQEAAISNYVASSVRCLKD